MTLAADEVLNRLRQAAQSMGGFILSVHAASRAAQRGITWRDIRTALLTARHATMQGNGNWRIEGLDDEGSVLVVVVAIRDRTVVVTVI